MRTKISVLFLGMVFICSASAVRAEGWKMPDLNPFDNNRQTTPNTGTSKSWLPSWKSNPNGTGTKMWNKVKQAPSDMANGTKRAMNAVNPFKGASTTNSRPLTGSNLDKPQPTKKWFAGWGASEEEQNPPQTVSDFIAGPRPE
jgi:hypothetical protein